MVIIEKEKFVSLAFLFLVNTVHIKITNNENVYAFKVTDGRYCATGYKTDLEIVLGLCYLLDKTPPVVNLQPGVITSRLIQVEVGVLGRYHLHTIGRYMGGSSQSIYRGGLVEELSN